MTRHRWAVILTVLNGVVILAGSLKIGQGQTLAAKQAPALASSDASHGLPGSTSDHRRPDAIDDRRVLSPDRRQLAGR